MKCEDCKGREGDVCMVCGSDAIGDFCKACAENAKCCEVCGVELL